MQADPSQAAPHRPSALGNAKRVLRAIATNQLARVAPTTYVRLTGQTGRGAAAEEGAQDIAAYFRDSLAAYFDKLGLAPADIGSFLQGKTLMEYGPGDLPGVAALMVAHGAEKVYCVDRFPLVNLSAKNARVMADLLAGCSAVQRERLKSCLLNPEDPRAGFDPRRVEYLVRPGGMSQLNAAVDFVFSRAVLEHVNDLDATFSDMVQAMRVGATAIHLVDLRSHGLHRSNPLDFLEWSPTLWHWMYSEKGVPNRWRVDKYRSIIERLPCDVDALEATLLAASEDVRGARAGLDGLFSGISDSDLAWLGFWLVLRKRAS